MDGWRALEIAEYDDLWDRFERLFAFHPSMEPEHWPGIREPVPSATYDIGKIYGRPDAAELEDELNEKVLTALRTAVAPNQEIYALDWKHPAYAFRPHAQSDTTFVVPVLPNGDYYIFVPLDLSFGIFGHPWEQTICIFGSSLLAALAENAPLLLTQPIRINAEVV